MWSNQALMPGYTRTLLNFEIDTLTGALTIPGGFHVNTIAAGCTYIDKVILPRGTLIPKRLLLHSLEMNIS